MGDMAGGRTIVLLMSGGVDSSVAALLLLREGWRVLGLTLRIPGVWGGPGEAGNGPPVEAGASAARMAGVLSICLSKIIRELLPFRYPIKLDTLIFGGILTNICT